MCGVVNIMGYNFTGHQIGVGSAVTFAACIGMLGAVASFLLLKKKMKKNSFEQSKEDANYDFIVGE